MSARAKDIPYMRMTQTVSIPLAGTTTWSAYTIPDTGPTGTVWGEFVTSIRGSIRASAEPIVKSNEVLSLTIEDSPNLSYQILRPIPVIVEKDVGCVVASFNEANVHVSGDTVAQAIRNLRLYIGDVFDELSELGPDALGPGPSRELAVLQSYIQKRDAQ